MPTTFFWDTTAGSCTGSASGFDDRLNETGGTGGTETDSVTAGTTDRISFRLSTDAGVPGLTTWAAGNYSVLFDCTERGNNIDVAFNPRRVNSSCVSQADFGTSAEVDPPQVGLNTLTVSGVAEQAAAVGDLLQIDLLVDNNHSHATQNFGVDYNDSEVNVPFPAAARRVFIIS